MKADVYTGFLTSKVKVYGTEKDTKPVVVSGRHIRMAIPLLLASVMSLSACAQKSNTTDASLEGQSVTSHLVEAQTKLLEINAEKEFLPEEKIQALLSDTSQQVLNDENFNHMPENNANFWEIVKKGIEVTHFVQGSSRLTDAQKAEYKIMAHKMLSQISRIKGTEDEVDLRDFNTLKAFLYFEKVAQYKDRYWKVLGRYDGTIDERSETLGRYYQDQEALKERVETNRGVQKFAEALYGCDGRFVLQYADSVQANQMSRELLKDWLNEQNITEKNLWYYVSTDEYDYCNTLSVYRSRGRSFRMVLGVDPTGDLGQGMYSPVGSTIIHELEHLMQQAPKSRETPEDNQKADADVHVPRARYDDYTAELGPTLHSLVLDDLVYKKINGIEPDVVVDYGNIDLGNHKVSIGETAVWFNRMMKKYNHKSVDKVLMEPEVLQHLNDLGNGGQVMTRQSVRGGME